MKEGRICPKGGIGRLSEGWDRWFVGVLGECSRRNRRRPLRVCNQDIFRERLRYTCHKGTYHDLHDYKFHMVSPMLLPFEVVGVGSCKNDLRVR